MSVIIKHVDSFFEELLKDDSVRYSLDPNFEKSLCLHELRRISKKAPFSNYNYSFIGKLDSIFEPVRDHAENIELLKKTSGSGSYNKHVDALKLSETINEKARKLMDSCTFSSSEVSYRHLFERIILFIKNTTDLVNEEYRAIA